MLFLIPLLLSSYAHALIMPKPISRRSVSGFVTEGVFEGGRAEHANIKNMRFSSHKDDGFERWVIDFDTDDKNKDANIPPFQLRYQRAVIAPADSDDSFSESAKFVFLFRSIQKNNLDEIKLRRLAKKSRWVKEIIVYPQIEGGDMAMEWVLSKNVKFEAFEPLEKPGRIVVDMRPLK